MIRSKVWRARTGGLGAALVLAALLVAAPAGAAPVAGGDVTYTSSADFLQGTLVNVNAERVADQLQLNKETSTFPRIWIAMSNRGTIVRINTNTGEILGEYRTAPQSIGYPDPSRTTVTLDGSAWAGNRQGQSVVHVGNVDANQCVDRNANGKIDTSTGYGDVRAWPGDAGAANVVSQAADECILHFTRTTSTATRTVTVNADGNLWVSGWAGSNDRVFNLIDGKTGQVLRTEGPFNCGGYGGLIDRNGIVWSASSGSSVLRWDPNAALGATNPTCVPVNNYGIALAPDGNIWLSQFSGNLVHKLAPDGALLGSFPHGSSNAQGLAVAPNGHVWVSSSLSGGTTVGHLLGDGTLVGSVPNVGNGSTGVAVDAAGKIWTANINSHTATRIDPNAGDDGAGGVKIGAVDLTVPFPATNAGPEHPDWPNLPESSPYNYSDMTGAVLLSGTTPQGTWTVVQDGGSAGHAWGKVLVGSGPALALGIARAADVAGGSVTIEVRAADTEVALGSQQFTEVGNGDVFDVKGRFLEGRITLKPNAAKDSPTVTDVRICDVAGCKPAAVQRPVTTPATTAPVTGVSKPRVCSSRRSFTIRIRRPKGQRIKSAKVVVAGKAVKVRKVAGRFVATVNLRTLPVGTYQVKITVKTRSGKTITGVRKYKTCSTKLIGGVPKL